MLQRIRTVVMAMVLALVAHPALAQDDHPAQVKVESAVTEMIDVLKNEGDRLAEDEQYLETKVNEIIVPHVDFETMTRLVVGKFWRRAEPAQQEELVEQFQALLMNTYAGALTEYGNESIRFEPFRPEDRDDRATVRSVFSPGNGEEVPVNYFLREKDGEGWSIYDIEVNNLSLVSNYRTAFSTEISRGGIEGLLETLRERNADS